jgi:hypothetical protein
MAPKLTPTPPEPPASPAAPTTPEPAAAPAGREESHAEKLYRAQSVELESLRRQLEGVPDADSLAELKCKAERFDQLANELPSWREKLASTFEGETLALKAQLEQQQAQLTTAQRETEALKAFVASGGNARHWPELLRLLGDHIQTDDSGVLVCTATGNPQPISEAFKAMADDTGSVLPAFWHPQFGTGSGGRSSVNVPPQRGTNFHSLSTADKFRAGFLNK